MEITVHVPKKRGENLPDTLTDSLPAPPLQSRRQTESIMNPISRLLCYPLWLPFLLCVVVVVVAVKHASLYVAGVTGNGQRAKGSMCMEAREVGTGECRIGCCKLAGLPAVFSQTFSVNSSNFLPSLCKPKNSKPKNQKPNAKADA